MEENYLSNIIIKHLLHAYQGYTHGFHFIFHWVIIFDSLLSRFGIFIYLLLGWDFFPYVKVMWSVIFFSVSKSESYIIKLDYPWPVGSN